MENVSRCTAGRERDLVQFEPEAGGFPCPESVSPGACEQAGICSPLGQSSFWVLFISIVLLHGTCFCYCLLVPLDTVTRGC